MGVNTGSPKPRRSFGIRLIEPRSLADIAAEMDAIGCDPRARDILVPKAQTCLLRVDGVSRNGANVLKQEMLARDGDAVLPSEAALGGPQRVSVLLIGTHRQFRSLCRHFTREPQSFGLSDLAAAIDAALKGYRGERLGVTRCGELTLEWGTRTYVMGILNVTPDSFARDGVGSDVAAAVARALQLVDEGADVLDVGGESTRPGSEPVDEAEELRRVLPVLRALAGEIGVPISIDTYRARVAEAALEAGAAMINDISGLSKDPHLARMAAERRAPLVVSHYRPFGQSDYRDLMGEVTAELKANLQRALEAGVLEENVILDPGIGFGKKAAHSLELIGRLGELRIFGRPLLVGPSRKSFLGRLLELPVEERLEGTAASVALAIGRGADMVRVHDVGPMARVARVADAIARSPWTISNRSEPA